MISCEEIGKPAGMVRAGTEVWSSRAVMPAAEKSGLESKSSITLPANQSYEVDPFLIEAVTEKLLQNPENIPPALMGAAIRHMLNLDVNQREVEIQMALGAVDPKYKLAVGLFLEAAIEVWAERQGFTLVKTAEYDAQKSEVFSVLQDERGKGLFRRLLDASFNHDSVLAEKMLQATRRLSLEKKELDKQIRDALMRLSAITEKTDATVERANRLHELAAERSEEVNKHVSESRAKIQVELELANKEAMKIGAEATALLSKSQEEVRENLLKAQNQAQEIIGAAQLAVEQSQQKLLTCDAEFNRHLLETKEQAANTIRISQGEATSIVESAKEKAALIHREAEKEASAIIARAQVSISKHEAEATSTLRQKEDKLRLTIASLEAQIETTQLQHPDLIKELDLIQIEQLARVDFLSGFSFNPETVIKVSESCLARAVCKTINKFAEECDGETEVGSYFSRITQQYLLFLRSMALQISSLHFGADEKRKSEIQVARLAAASAMFAYLSEWIGFGAEDQKINEKILQDKLKLFEQAYNKQIGDKEILKVFDSGTLGLLNWALVRFKSSEGLSYIDCDLRKTMNPTSIKFLEGSKIVVSSSGRYYALITEDPNVPSYQTRGQKAILDLKTGKIIKSRAGKFDEFRCLEDGGLVVLYERDGYSRTRQIEDVDRLARE